MKIEIDPMSSYRRLNKGYIDISVFRLQIVAGLMIIGFIGLAFRLFNIQVIGHSKYLSIAKEQHTGDITIQSRRGEILTADRDDQTLYKLATNTTLDLLYVDPSVHADKEYVSRTLAPFVLTPEDYSKCKNEARYCPLNLSLTKIILDDEDEESEKKDALILLSDEGHAYKTYEEALLELQTVIRNKISKDEVDYSVLKSEVRNEVLQKVYELRFSGIFVDVDEQTIFANPKLVPERDKTAIARALSIVLEMPYSTIEARLTRRKIRYVPLKRKLDPDVSVALRELMEKEANEAHIDPNKTNNLRGVVLQPESWRHYPNDSVAAQIIGFHSVELGGQYGLEEAFNRDLQGTPGAIIAENDPFNRPITFGDNEVISAINGESFIVSIALPVQKKVEEILAEAVENYRADTGQVLIVDPMTGHIITMAHFPTYNPNEYSRVFEKRSIEKKDFVPKSIPAFVKDETGAFRVATDEEREEKKIDKYIYKNRIGPEAYKNSIVQAIYEPGSVFKPVTMAIALDRKLVEPGTKMCDKTGYLDVDEFRIFNAEKVAHGCQTMTNVLENSSNMGMAFVAKKLGKPLFYSYIKSYGFGEYTDVELLDEQPGTVRPWKQWSESKLITTSFGQGISSTPLQVVMAWSALANGGLLYQPRIIKEKFDSEQNRIPIEPRVIRRIIGPDTSAQISSMLVSTLDNGVAAPARMEKHYAAGKTGTSQIAKTNGAGYEKGEGSFITSFAGYFPVHHPRFVILVKFDRPRIGENTYGSTTAAPVFKEISEYLAHYYNIPPDREGFVGMAF